MACGPTAGTPSVSGPSPLLEPRVPPHLSGARLGGREKTAPEGPPHFHPFFCTYPAYLFPRGHMSLTEAKQVPLRIEAAFWSPTLCGHHGLLHLAPAQVVLSSRKWALGLDLTPVQIFTLQAGLCGPLTPLPNLCLASTTPTQIPETEVGLSFFLGH